MLGCDAVSHHAAFRLLAFSMLCVAVLPRLADRGMFLDGVTYAAISRNLAEGSGTLWHPHYTKTVYPDFHEQPPLGMGLQALLFAVMGDHVGTERLYSFLVGALSMGLVVWIWRVARRDEGLRENGWMPAVLWITAPVVSWSIVNNMLESTQSMFTLLAVGSAIGALGTAGRPSLAWAALSGSAVTAALLTKGPVGLFPLATPWAYWTARASTGLFAKRPAPVARLRRVGLVSAIQVGVTCVTLLAVLSYGPARTGLQSYLDQQLRPTIAGARETSATRLRFARKLAQDLLPMTALTALVLYLARRRLTASPPENWQWAGTFLLLGIAASVPLAVSPKQSGHYVVPSMPLFALAFASMIGGAWAGIAPVSVRARRRMLWAAALLIGGSAAVLAARWGTAGRDAQRLNDLERVFEVVPRGTTLGLCSASMSDWGLHAYAQRLWRASLDGGAAPHRWALAPHAYGCAAPDGCEAVALDTTTMALYDCAPPETRMPSGGRSGAPRRSAIARGSPGR